MSTSAPAPHSPWHPLTPAEVTVLLTSTPARWWLSGGAALDHALGRRIRPHPNTDVSVVGEGVVDLVASLPPEYSAWVNTDTDDEPAAFTRAVESHSAYPRRHEGRVGAPGEHRGWQPGVMDIQARSSTATPVADRSFADQWHPNRSTPGTACMKGSASPP